MEEVRGERKEKVEGGGSRNMRGNNMEEEDGGGTGEGRGGSVEGPEVDMEKEMGIQMDTGDIHRKKSIYRC